MTTEQWSQIVAASVVPVVAISASSLLCLGFYNRLAYIVSRLRGFQRERIDIQERFARDHTAAPPDRFAAERHRRLLAMLETQNNEVIRQARLVRVIVYCLLATIGCLTACSLTAGLGVVLPAAKYAATALFISGMLLLLLSIVLAMVDLRRAVDVVEKESLVVSELEDDIEAVADDTKRA